KSGRDHSVQSIASRASNTDHFDPNRGHHILFKRKHQDTSLDKIRVADVRRAQWLKELKHPGPHTIEHLMQRPSAAKTGRGHLLNMVPGMEQQADTRGMHGITDDVA